MTLLLKKATRLQKFWSHCTTYLVSYFKLGSLLQFLVKTLLVIIGELKCEFTPRHHKHPQQQTAESEAKHDSWSSWRKRRCYWSTLAFSITQLSATTALTWHEHQTLPGYLCLLFFFFYFFYSNYILLLNIHFCKLEIMYNIFYIHYNSNIGIADLL